jgi:hypothetical protein
VLIITTALEAISSLAVLLNKGLKGSSGRGKGKIFSQTQNPDILFRADLLMFA